jgi:hypothetical protein
LDNANSRFFTDCYLCLSQFDPHSAIFPGRAGAFQRTIAAVIALRCGNPPTVSRFTTRGFRL